LEMMVDLLIEASRCCSHPEQQSTGYGDQPQAENGTSLTCPLWLLEPTNHSSLFQKPFSVSCPTLIARIHYRHSAWYTVGG
jgi:hypothetical protein